MHIRHSSIREPCEARLPGSPDDSRKINSGPSLYHVRLQGVLKLVNGPQLYIPLGDLLVNKNEYYIFLLASNTVDFGSPTPMAVKMLDYERNMILGTCCIAY